MEIKVLDRENSVQKKAFCDLVSYAFKMCKVEDFEKDWDQFTEEIGTIMGNWDEEQLASVIMISHREIIMNGKVVAMDGLGGVATSPIYRKGGICSGLIKMGLKQMYDTGAVFSVLAPFSYPFYEKLGWKWSYSYLTYHMPMAELSSFRGTEKLELISDSSHTGLIDFYNQQAMGMNGVAYRKQWNWDKRFELAPYRLLVKDEEDNVTGYILYDICQEQSVFKVWEIQYSGKATIETIFAYIYSHCGQVEKIEIAAAEHVNLLDHLKNPRIDCRKQPSMMLRIINIEEALKTYQYQEEGSFIIEVNDDVCQWNHKTLEVIIKQAGMIEVVQTSKVPDVKIDIRELAQVLSGFRTIDEVKHEGNSCNWFKTRRDKVALFDSF